jgi:hypothetical protein
MAVKRRSGGAWVDAASPKRKSGGAMIAVTSIKRRSGGAWIETLATPLVLSKSSDATGASTTSTIDSNAVTITATGGSGAAKTYAWDFTSNPSGITALSPSSATTVFRKTSAVPNATYTATARCTVADGTYSDSILVSVELERISDA